MQRNFPSNYSPKECTSPDASSSLKDLSMAMIGDAGVMNTQDCCYRGAPLIDFENSYRPRTNQSFNSLGVNKDSNFATF